MANTEYNLNSSILSKLEPLFQDVSSDLEGADTSGDGKVSNAEFKALVNQIITRLQNLISDVPDVDDLDPVITGDNPTFVGIQQGNTILDLSKIEKTLQAKSWIGHKHDASAIATGQLNLARIPTLSVAKIPDLPGSKITSGTIPVPVSVSASTVNITAAKDPTTEHYNGIDSNVSKVYASTQDTNAYKYSYLESIARPDGNVFNGLYVKNKYGNSEYTGGYRINIDKAGAYSWALRANGSDVPFSFNLTGSTNATVNFANNGFVYSNNGSSKSSLVMKDASGSTDFSFANNGSGTIKAILGKDAFTASKTSSGYAYTCGSAESFYKGIRPVPGYSGIIFGTQTITLTKQSGTDDKFYCTTAAITYNASFISSFKYSDKPQIFLSLQSATDSDATTTNGALYTYISMSPVAISTTNFKIRVFGSSSDLLNKSIIVNWMSIGPYTYS